MLSVMKLLKTYLAAMSLLGMATLSSCTDWGEADPPAGNQKIAPMTKLYSCNFEYDSPENELSDCNLVVGEATSVVADDYLGSNVLHLDGGYVRMDNPFRGQSLQKGAAITFWVKTAETDLTSALFSVGTSVEKSDSARFYFTENSYLSYHKPGQLQSLDLNVNNPDNIKTGAIEGGDWHFVALQLNNTGYTLYVDGLKRSENTLYNTSSTSFNYSQLMQHITDAPYLFIGAGSETTLCASDFDDITCYANEITQKEWKRPNVSGGGDTPVEDNKVYVPVGTADCTAGWWTAFSDYFTIPANQSFHTSFINHTSGAGNWNNWNLCVSTAAERGADGYAEYFVIRSDAYGWGDSFAADGSFANEGYPTNDDEWGQFRENMEGAKVDMTVQRIGAQVKVTAIATSKNGTIYKEVFTATCGDGTNDINAFLICDGSYLQLDPSETFIGEAFQSGSYVVGATDFTSGFFTEKSRFYKFPNTISADRPYVIEFVNNTAGSGDNWNNWVLCCSTTENGADGYFENFVLRADAYGWFGAGGNTAQNSAGLDFTMTSGYNWDTFVSDLCGATCYMGFSRTGNSLKVVAKQRTAAGVDIPDYTFDFNSMREGDAGFFLTQEMASLDILKVGYFPYFDKIFKKAE